uniref:ATP-dependent Clp protease proteolytic subunit n=1 Tax=Xylia xylocarpa TaxID=1489963 RepID=A0A890CFL2_9FABA|nr:clp protease proteolytic subunit [Xylia xylocarpa]QRG30710.1 clp protease proteolytic subunit [Xylia xylocarpa]
MPIGLPKVPYRIPGDEDASWVDMYNGLYRRRALFLFKELDTELSNQLMGIMIYLGIEEPNLDINLYINSPGGFVSPGIALYDVMRGLQADVQTICFGIAASVASYILLGGEVGKRLAVPHARIMMHQPSSAHYESYTKDFIWETSEVMRMREIVISEYVQRTGQPFNVVSADLERDVFMSAEQARSYGIIDEIARNEGKERADYINNLKKKDEY